MIDFSSKNPSGKPRVLLTGVFGPYGEDDQYGSRRMNPMELYHNQVTRTQGAFSLRMFHRTWGLMLIQANIQAPCNVLDFPTLDRFVEELKTERYDVIGISSIIPNIRKVEEMCRLIRQYQPEAKIVVGGHIANVPNLAKRIDVDHVVRGEGVRWFRDFLGEDVRQPINHPIITSGIGTRNIGMTLNTPTEEIAATIIPSVGCPLGCNFCSTSAMFGGKGHFYNFYQTGDQLFDVMAQIEKRTGVWSFFIMDENFLLHKKRALRLLELMEEHNKSWAIYVFSSANVLRSYTIDQLVRLGVSWVWMGLEGESSQYNKLDGADTFQLIRELQQHGIRVLGSTIIGLENHTEENIDEAIDYAVRHNTDLHQFMLYTPIPGTPLHAELSAKGLMKDPSQYEDADIHGQFIFNYRHPTIPAGKEAEMMVRAFDRDFEVNGPSTVRIVRTTLLGWQRYKNHPDRRIRRRFEREARGLNSILIALVAGSIRYYRKNPAMQEKLRGLLADLYQEFGLKGRFYGIVGGLYVLWSIRREEKRLASGWTYEPPTFYETNQSREATDALALCKYVEPKVVCLPTSSRIELTPAGTQHEEPAETAVS